MFFSVIKITIDKTRNDIVMVSLTRLCHGDGSSDFLGLIGNMSFSFITYILHIFDKILMKRARNINKSSDK